MPLSALLCSIFSRSWHDRAISLSSRFVFNDNKSVRILFDSWFKICVKLCFPSIFGCRDVSLPKTGIMYFHRRAISLRVRVPSVSLAKSKSVSVPSSIFNVRARHMERLIRYLSVHFVDSVEIPSVLRYASYFVPAGTIYMQMCARVRARTHTHSLCLFSSFYFSIYLSLSIYFPFSLALTDKRMKIAEILLRWKWRFFSYIRMRAHIQISSVPPLSILYHRYFSFLQTNVTRTKVSTHTVNCRRGKDNVKASLHSSPVWIFL